MRRVPSIGWPVKLFVSLFLMVILLRQYPLELGQLTSIFRSFRWWVLPILVPILLGQYLVSVLRWSRILRDHGIDLPLRNLLGSYMVGAFFGSFLPSSYGGDLVRIADVARGTGRTFESTIAMVLDRWSGLVVLAAVGAVASIHLGLAWDEPGLFHQAAVLGLLLLLSVAPFAPGALGLLRPVVRAIPIRRAAVLYRRVERTTRRYGARSRLLAEILGLSLLLQFMAFTNFYLYTRALDLAVPYLYCLAFVPIVFVLEALPVSVAGIGLREGALVYFLSRIGLGSAEAVSISMVLLSARALKVVFGAGVYAYRSNPSSWRVRTTGAHAETAGTPDPDP